MFTNSIHKKMYKTIINLIDNEKSNLKFLSSLNDLDDEMKEKMQEGVDIHLPNDLVEEISEKVFEDVRSIINGAGPGAATRFTLLLSNPEAAYENEYQFIAGEYLDVGTVYLIGCMALSGQKAKVKDALSLVDYLNSSAIEIKTGIRQQKMPKSSNRLKIIACILAVTTIILGCTTYYFHQKFIQATIDCVEMESERDLNFTELMNAEDSLDVYYDNFAFVTKSGTKYHKDGCPYTKDRGLYADSIADLKRQGYEPCSHCYGDNFLIWEQ